MRTSLPEIHQTAPTAGLTGRIRPQNQASLPKRRSSRHLGRAKHVYQMFLNGTYHWRKRLREINVLERPAKEFEGWIKVFTLAIILIAIEAVINAYLFSQGNEFGLLGGWLAAVIVSVVNVGCSAMLGYMTR